MIPLAMLFPFILVSGAAGDVAESDLTVGSWPTVESEFPELADFEGEVAFYAYAEFPPFKYEMPDCKTWVRGLEPIGGPGKGEAYVKVWSRGGRCRFVLVQDPASGWGQFLSLGDDRVSFANPGDPEGNLFMTEIGVVKWTYVYEGGLLAYIFYFQEGSRLWSLDRFEYTPGAVTPYRGYRYATEEDLVAGNWESRTDYDADGRVVDVEGRD
ncbi:MAG: hypothetical protein A2Y64_06920 [Candidatus Coatesbacteria bacterium RBG_13_66_14]|uniref:Uncharacterized protein n=1 Tax=Candidatus Coatesbacteria bacterium RBG_13_66_14 TaxID=1817816 RepID=A0A1F5FJA4_9BACT|nr:MAG: hypothetical protein A2Y64_06920 [Candidatus Coatesbacteria bacterium RBG_13_66_14]